MPTNDFLPFATAGGANVLTQAAYLAEAARSAGVVAGVGKSSLANKSWRQAALMAAALGQLINDYGGVDALDDGVPANLELALAQTLQGSKFAYAVATGTANAWILAPTPAVPAYAAGRVLWVVAPATNTSTTVNINISTLGNRRIKRADGSDPAVGDLVSGRLYPIVDDGTNVRVVSALPSEIVASVALQAPIAERFSFSTAGTTTFTPTVTGWYLLEMWGGGGGGGAGASTGGGGGGGAAGRVIDYVYLIAGTAYTYTVGAGGNLGPGSNNAGSSGGASSFVGPAGTIVATQGAGGSGANAGGGGTAGAGGAGSGYSALGNTDVGQSGYQGSPQISQGGAGGSSVGGGYGGAASFGTGNAGGAPGAGGSGSSSGGNGGQGANGRVNLARLGV